MTFRGGDFSTFVQIGGEVKGNHMKEPRWGRRGLLILKCIAGVRFVVVITVVYFGTLHLYKVKRLSISRSFDIACINFVKSSAYGAFCKLPFTGATADIGLTREHLPMDGTAI